MTNSEYNVRYVAEQPDVAIVELSSSVLGGNDALVFANKLDELTNSGKKCIIIDAGTVQIMNSTGIGMLAHSHSSLAKNGYRMMLVNVPDKVMKLLKMTHLDRVFKIYDNIESALADCR